MRAFIYVICLLLFFVSSPLMASEVPFFHGYVTNRDLKEIKLKVSKVEQDSFLLGKNIEDNSFIPYLNLKITAETALPYFLNSAPISISIPEGTKFSGYISEIEPNKSFDRKGFYRAKFNKVICPSGETIYLKEDVSSRSLNKVYNPFSHVGKAALNVLGGVLAGSLFSYQYGGIPLILASHGYSLIGGALAGGFIGTINGIASKGKESTIQPGDELTLIPVNDLSLSELKQISCKVPIYNQGITPITKDVQIEIHSVKCKKDFFGDAAFKIDITFINNSSNLYRLSNFFLLDSQGKEYSTTFLDLKDDLFIEFPPKRTKYATLEFVIDYPKASHWLVLKNNTFSEEVGRWRIED